MKKNPEREIVIISGMSGSGKSSALNVLEDAGYFAIDNLPGPIFPVFLDLLKPKAPLTYLKRVALAMDTRQKFFAENFKDYIRILQRRKIKFKVLFLDAHNDILFRRFSETRRRHPMAPNSPVPSGIRKEREILRGLRSMATHVIDTSYLNVHQLRTKVLSTLKHHITDGDLSLNLLSFGYRYGLPLESDLVFDMRFLPNPHFIDRLRPLTGQNAPVAHFILKQKSTRAFLKRLKDLLRLLLSQYQAEGKSYLTVAFGCTGGRHRSVAIAAHMAEHLKRLGHSIKLVHRDLDREKGQE